MYGKGLIKFVKKNTFWINSCGFIYFYFILYFYFSYSISFFYYKDYIQFITQKDNKNINDTNRKVTK